MAKGPSEKFKSSKKGGKGKSLSKSALSEVKQAADYAKKIGSDKTFSDLVKEYKQVNVKYDRPATFRGSYGEETNKVGTPLASTYYKDPVTGQERFFTAQAPTFKQLMGDVGRAFSGYNTLSYDPNAQGIATTTGGQIVRQPGLIENFGIPYIGTALKIGNAVSDAWNKIRGYFSPNQTPQGIETKFPVVTPEAKEYFGGYNQGIETQMPVAEDRGMNIPVSTAQPFPDYYDSNNTLGNIFLNSQGYDVPISNDLRAELSPEDQQKMINQYMFEKMIREEIDRNKQRKIYDDMQMFQPKENPVYAENIMPTSVMDLYNFARNPQLTTDYGNLRLDNVLGGKPQFGFETDLLGGKIGLSANPLENNYGVKYTATFNKGGSVDKYSGLGYMLK